MKKKVIIGIGIFVALIVAAGFYLDNRNRTLSPPGKLEMKIGDANFLLDYSRPSKRGRVIFGSPESEALLVYGNYWRLGANEGTEFECNKNMVIAGNKLAAGRYRIYTIPQAESFEIFVSTEIGAWGYSEPDQDLNLFSFSTSVETNENSVEQFTFRTDNLNEAEFDLIFEWGRVLVRIPIQIEE
ncbi:MAG: DUF2911 domain-containing protein [Salibacteraceae bacterium]